MTEYIQDIPNLLKYWDFQNNKDIDITTTKVNTRKEVCWYCPKCSKGWQASIQKNYNRSLKYENFCPYCDLAEILAIGVNNISAKFPDFERYINFHVENKEEIKKILETEMFTSSHIFNLKCPTCRHSWRDVASSSILSQSPNGDLYHIGCNEHCYHLEYKRLYPNVRKIYKRKGNKPTLSKLSLKDNVTIPHKWVCDECSDEFELSIDKLFSRIKRLGYYCLNCKATFNKLMHNNYSKYALSYMDPSYMNEWSIQNEFLPSRVDLLSSIKVKWDCPICLGTYSCTVSEKSKESCPYCNKQIILQDFNTLNITHPYLGKFWSNNNSQELNHYWQNSTEKTL